MPTLNFVAQFAKDVESGKKRSTIRAKRKRPIRPGDRLYLYTAQRTRDCRKLGEADCLSVYDIMIGNDNHIKLCGESLSFIESTWVARLDGFQSYPEFLAFFQKRHGLPFHGDVIEW